MNLRKNPVKDAHTLIMLCFITYSVLYVGRKNFSACMTGMIEDGIINKIVGGGAGTAFLVVYAAGQLINGFIGDKVSPEYIIPSGLFGVGLMNISMGFVTSGALVPVIWGINGFFCSMLWSPIIRSLSEWLSEENRPKAGFLMSITIPIGSILSYVTCAVMLKFFNWRYAFIACGLIVAVMGVIFIIGITSISPYIAQRKEQRLNERKLKYASESSVKYTIPFLIAATGLYFAVIGVMFNGILKDGLDLWVPTYISEYFGLALPTSSLVTSVLPAVHLPVSFYAQYLNIRHIHCEMKTAAVMFGISTVSFGMLILIKLTGATGSAAVVATVILLSLSSASMLGANNMFLTFIPFHFSAVGRSSAVTGFLNSCSYAAAALSGITIGVISTEYGWTFTVLTFMVCSALGFAACIIGSAFWQRGKEKIK